MNPITELLQRLIADQNSQVFIAVATGNVSGNLIEIRRTEQAAADAQMYPRLEGVADPTLDDELLILRVGSGLIVLGKVLR